MKRVVFLGMVVGSLLVLPAQADLSDYLSDGVDVGSSVVDTGQWSGISGGGEFSFYNADLNTDAYADVTKNQYSNTGSFQTFCVEKDEYVYPPDYVVEKTIVNEYEPGKSRAVLGGKGGGEPDPLSPFTAYLYTMFATGQLDGYRYTGSDAERRSDADALQTAIWAIENEIGTGGLSGQAKTWYDDALDSGWTTIGDVRVLNLYVTTGGLDVRQDMLHLVPLPGAVLLGFLGLGYAGMRLRKMA